MDFLIGKMGTVLVLVGVLSCPGRADDVAVGKGIKLLAEGDRLADQGQFTEAVTWQKEAIAAAERSGERGMEHQAASAETIPGIITTTAAARIAAAAARSAPHAPIRDGRTKRATPTSSWRWSAA